MFLLTDRDLDVRKYWRSEKIKVLPVQNNGHRKSQNKYSQNGACASNKLKQKLIAKNLHCKKKKWDPIAALSPTRVEL